ncbi:hypothetical protein SAMN05920897_10294 [Alkalispirochaeta americana]|uniref:DUF2764 domain-containing protein n=1 Tax=Alkalispirochaeta americana TaxID=159291 RepID=A0A1N6P297_9SPIO|nr:hypothetical protein [Alkalispirochaeta americana]SIP98508.1 hypothetical protein SAMN05920897_10294 [Alkalispirochaeta americana]
MNRYYYTVASLPAVRFEEAPFLSEENFLEMCRVEATPEDLEYIASARLLPETLDTPAEGVLERWNRAVREFRCHAAQLRAQNLGWEADRLPRPEGIDASMAERTRSIVNEDTPLKMENALMRWLWQVAEDLECGHHFDREQLVVYHLKLQLAARRARLADSSRGGEEYDRQYETVAHSLMEIAT